MIKLKHKKVIYYNCKKAKNVDISIKNMLRIRIEN